MSSEQEEIENIYLKQYTDAINAYVKLLDCKKNNKPHSKFLKIFNDQTFGFEMKMGFARMHLTTKVMLYNYLTEITSMSAVCIKVALDGEQCILGYVYFTNDGDEVIPSYVCACPTMTSKDGEYRSRFVRWDDFISTLEKYSEDLVPLEQMICSKMESGELTFQADMYCLDDVNKVKEFTNNNRIVIKLFMFTWIPDFHNYYNKFIPNHLNPVYKKIICREDDIPIYELIHANVSKRDPRPNYAMKLMVFTFSALDGIKSGWTNPILPTIGQKIIPVTGIEALLPEDINFSTWREIWINQRASNLVINAISPSFPVMNSWFFIPSTHVGLFDNPAMREKYEDAEVATEIISQLHITDEKNYIDDAPRSSKFAHLSQNIRESIKYAAKDIKLSNLAVCMLGQDVGKTLRDFPAYVASGLADDGEKLFLTSEDVFAKHIFEFIYAFYCMNTVSGLIHGDLHLNNATIYLHVRHVNVVYAKEDGFSPTDDMRVVYMCLKPYVFPLTGCFSSLIDFSRAIIVDEHEITSLFGKRYADIYFHNQVDRIMDLLTHHLPEFTERNRTTLLQVATLHPAILFKTLSIIDTYTLMNNISAMIEVDPNMKKIDFPMKMVDWLKDIHEHAEKLLIEGLTNCITGKYSSVSDFEWPNLVIIEKHFAKYEPTDELINDDNVTFIDMYNAESKLNYDISNSTHWGPILSSDRAMKESEEKGLDLNMINEWKRHIHRDSTMRGKQMMENIIVEEWMLE